MEKIIPLHTTALGEGYIGEIEERCLCSLEGRKVERRKQP